MAQIGWTAPSEEEYKAFSGYSPESIGQILCMYLLTESSMGDVAKELLSGIKDSRTVSQITRCLGFSGKNKYLDDEVFPKDVYDYISLYYPDGYRDETLPDFDEFINQRLKKRRELKEHTLKKKLAFEQREREKKLFEEEALMQKKIEEKKERERLDLAYKEEIAKKARIEEEKARQELERRAKELEEQTKVQKFTYEWCKITAFLNNDRELNIKDEEEIVKNYKLLYDSKYGDAINNYGWFYHNLSLKTGKEKNKIIYLTNAAKANYPLSMNNYGALIEAGAFGIPPDLNNALAWYEGAAAKGDDYGMMNSGRLLLDMGEYEKAKHYLGNVRFKFSDRWVSVYWAKAVIYSAYYKTLADKSSAVDLFRDVIKGLDFTEDETDRYHASLVIYYSAIFEFIDCYGIGGRQKEMLMRLERASDFGLPLADLFLGNYYFFMNLENINIEKARRYYMSAVRKDNAEAMYMLAKTYLSDNTYTKSDAVALMEKAYEKGYGEAGIWLERHR